MGKSQGNYLKSGSHPSLLVRDTGNYSEVRSQSVFFYDQKRTVSCKKKKGAYCCTVFIVFTSITSILERDFTVNTGKLALKSRFLSGFIYYPK